MYRNPCRKDCPERAEGCHARCERYAEFWKECERMRLARAMNRICRDERAGFRKGMLRKASLIRQGREK